MQYFDVQELKELMTYKNGPAVSIFLPTHEVSPPQDRRDQIALKNAIARAEILLQEHDLRGSVSDAILKPAKDLLSDGMFWQYQNKGLALFLAQDFHKIYRLPLNFQSQVVVNHHFQITPLIPFFDTEQRFYVLALSMNEIKLYEADAMKMREIPAAELPENLQEVLQYDVFEKQLQFHTGGGGGQSPVYHGHGEEGYTRKQQIHAYAQAINKGLSDMLKVAKVPLVVAAVDYVFAIFKQHCDYAGLVEKPIAGNVEHLSVKELHEKALAHVSEPLAQQRQEALSAVQALKNSERLLSDVDQVIEAAKQSRIEKLLVLQPEAASDTAVIEVREMDPVNTAAVETLLHGGEVYTVDADTLASASNNTQSPLAAVLRF